MLEQTSLKCRRSAFDSEDDDCDDHAQQNDGESHNQTEHVLRIVEELRDRLLAARHGSGPRSYGCDYQCEKEVFWQCVHD
jgi:hypothetical protein